MYGDPTSSFMNQERNPIERLKSTLMDQMLLTPESQINYLTQELQRNEELQKKLRKRPY